MLYIPCTKSFPTARWVKLDSDVFWDGPPSVSAKIILKLAYPGLSVFFSQQLQIPDTPPDVLLRELERISGLFPDRTIDEQSHVHIHNIFKDIVVALDRSPDTVRDWLPKLQDVPFVPVENELGDIELKELQEGLYLPDHSYELAGFFRKQVPLVTIPPAGSANSLSSLYTLFSHEPLNVVRPLGVVVQKTLSADEKYPAQSLTDRYRSGAEYLPR